ncbi:hypothetical protein ACT7DD_26495 [Bacillus paranthracis]
MNQKEIPDKEISIMYERSFAYVGKLKKKWEREGKWIWIKKITFKAKKDIYWEDWEHLRLVFSRGNVYPVLFIKMDV